MQFRKVSSDASNGRESDVYDSYCKANVPPAAPTTFTSCNSQATPSVAVYEELAKVIARGMLKPFK